MSSDYPSDQHPDEEKLSDPKFHLSNTEIVSYPENDGTLGMSAPMVAMLKHQVPGLCQAIQITNGSQKKNFDLESEDENSDVSDVDEKVLEDEYIYRQQNPDGFLSMDVLRAQLKEHKKNQKKWAIQSRKDAKNPLYNDFSKEMKENEHGMIGVVTNFDYGGFSFSAELEAIMQERGTLTCACYIKRTNKVLVEALIEEEASENHTDHKLVINWIDKKYFKGPGFWSISEYDGSEGIVIDDRAYNLWEKEQMFNTFISKGREVIGSSGSSDQKLVILNQMFSEFK